MVKPAKTRRTEEIIAEDFVNKAMDEIKNNTLEIKKRGRGNPRLRKNKTISISISLELDSYINELIDKAAKDGIFGITRSDIITIALTNKSMNVENALKDIKQLKIRSYKTKAQ